MFDSLYEFFRGGAGFALIVGGLSRLLMPSRDKVHRRLGLLLVAVGFLFSLSALDPVLRIPTDASNLLILAAILALSQSLFEIALFLFGDERHLGTARRVLKIGIAWSLLVLLAPLLDYVIGWETVERSVEDAASMGPLHTAASIAIYLWPIAISVIAAWVGRASLRDVPTHAPGTKTLVRGAVALVLVLSVILVGAALDSIWIYRAGHLALEFLMLVWFLFASARPDLFSRARHEIHETLEKNLLFSESEALTIGDRIAKVTANPALLCRPGLNLRSLAGIIKIPPYRLSLYFNGQLKTTFPAWLNAHRIERIRRQILEEPERSILDIALEAGYGSKSVFNGHFLRIVGMSPRDYRRSSMEKTQASAP